MSILNSKTELEAAKAYNKKALELYGSYSKLNIFYSDSSGSDSSGSDSSS
jgi:hypothetical protein